MFRRKDEVEVRRVVWRMSAGNPAGAYVRPSDPAPIPCAPVETPQFGWSATRLEFLNGVRVSEAPLDTLPAELIDAFNLRRR